MINQYRDIERGELLIVGCDTSYGANDYCVGQFYSLSKFDFPLVYRAKVAAPKMTDTLFPALEWLADFTGYKPVVGYERQNGGAFEMERLEQVNRLKKYSVFLMPQYGVQNATNTERMGWDTNSATRPDMLSNLQGLIDNKAIKIYDEATIKELFSFIVKDGRAEAEKTAHDDCVMSLAIALKMAQYVDKNAQILRPPEPEYSQGESRSMSSFKRR